MLFKKDSSLHATFFSFLLSMFVLFSFPIITVADESSVSSGTGWIVAPHFIVTNNHVVGEESTVTVIFTNNRQIRADVVMRDTVNDVAILKPRKTKQLPPGLPIAVSSTNVGANVFTIGYPLLGIMGREPKLTTGIVNSRTGIANDPRTYQISVPLQPGNSGGPVFNMNGEVIGIATSSLSAAAIFKWAGNMPQNVNYAVKTNYVRALLDAVPVQSSDVVNTLSNEPANLEQLVSRVQNSIVIILSGAADEEPASASASEAGSKTGNRSKQQVAFFVLMKPHNYDVRQGYTKEGVDDTVNNYSKTVAKMVKKYLKKVSDNSLVVKKEFIGKVAENVVYEAFDEDRRQSICDKNKVNFLFVTRSTPQTGGFMDITYYIYDCKSKADFYYTKNMNSIYSDTFMYESSLRKFLRNALEDKPGSIKMNLD